MNVMNKVLKANKDKIATDGYLKYLENFDKDIDYNCSQVNKHIHEAMRKFDIADYDAEAKVESLRNKIEDELIAELNLTTSFNEIKPRGGLCYDLRMTVIINHNCQRVEDEAYREIARQETDLHVKQRELDIFEQELSCTSRYLCHIRENLIRLNEIVGSVNEKILHKGFKITKKRHFRGTTWTIN